MMRPRAEDGFKRGNRVRRSLLMLVLAASSLFAGKALPPLTPVSDFHLDRYLGKWYEIARLPAWFERGMDSVTATYSLREDGKVNVLNEGTRKGKRSKAEGVAKLGGSAGEGRLRVSFFRPFYADYTIVELDTASYGYALVVSDRKYLWILSRTPSLDQAIVSRFLGKAAELGFDTMRLYFTKQPR